jgi:hypothetical protein
MVAGLPAPEGRLTMLGRKLVQAATATSDPDVGLQRHALDFKLGLTLNVQA